MLITKMKFLQTFSFLSYSIIYRVSYSINYNKGVNDKKSSLYKPKFFDLHQFGYKRYTYLKQKK